MKYYLSSDGKIALTERQITVVATILKDMFLKFYENPENEKAFQDWLSEQNKNKEVKNWVEEAGN